MALEDADYLGTLLDMFELKEPEAKDALSESAVETSTLQSDSPGQAFLSWVKEGILSHKLIINDSKAKIHTVDGSVFFWSRLVSSNATRRNFQAFRRVQIRRWRNGVGCKKTVREAEGSQKAR
nr:hypothetical protein GCM10020185_01230 [Pseudomonas brassicacearum subsp. brassicacearum]